MTDAMEKIRQQLDLLRTGSSIGGPSDDRSVIADLEAEIEALKAARAGPGVRRPLNSEPADYDPEAASLAAAFVREPLPLAGPVAEAAAGLVAIFVPALRPRSPTRYIATKS